MISNYYSKFCLWTFQIKFSVIKLWLLTNLNLISTKVKFYNVWKIISVWLVNIIYILRNIIKKIINLLKSKQNE